MSSKVISLFHHFGIFGAVGEGFFREPWEMTFLVRTLLRPIKLRKVGIKAGITEAFTRLHVFTSKSEPALGSFMASKTLSVNSEGFREVQLFTALT